MKMKTQTLASALTLSIATALVSPHARAGELSLGIAAGTQSHLYRDQEDAEVIVPVIGFEGERFSFFLDTAAWTIVGQEIGDYAWRARIVATARIFDQPHHSSGLEDRDSTLEAGLEASLKSPWGNLTLQTVADTLGKYDGFEGSVSYAYELTVTEKLTLTPGIGASYYDEKLADYYFGVRDSEVRPGRPAWHPEEGGTLSASVIATYAITDRWTLMGVVEHTTLSDELAESPLIEEKSSITAVVGVMYRF